MFSRLPALFLFVVTVKTVSFLMFVIVVQATGLVISLIASVIVVWVTTVTECITVHVIISIYPLLRFPP